MPLTRSGEHERRVGLRDEERRREAEESRRQEDNARFEALISMLAAQRQTPQVPPEDDGEDPENPTRRQPQQPRTPSTQKPAAQIPPPLKPDATYQLLRRRAEEIDICPGKSSVCEETQLKSVILMGVRDDELIQRLISLDDKCSLQEMVTACRSYEAARCATSDIRAQPTQSTAKTAELCQCCARYHETGACPAAQVTCRNCGRQGNFASTVKCPASKAQCRLCSRIGHFDSCCKKVSRQNHKRGSTDGAPTPSQQKSKQLSCRRVISPSPAVPQHVSVLVTHGVLGLDFMFRKAVMIKPAHTCDGGKMLQLTFDGDAVEVEQDPDGAQLQAAEHAKKGTTGDGIRGSRQDSAMPGFPCEGFHAPLFTTRSKSKKRKQQTMNDQETLSEKAKTQRKEEAKQPSKKRRLESMEDCGSHRANTEMEGVKEMKHRTNNKGDHMKGCESSKSSTKLYDGKQVKQHNKKKRKAGDMEDYDTHKKRKVDGGEEDMEHGEQNKRKDRKDRKTKATEGEKKAKKRKTQDIEDHESQPKKSKTQGTEEDVSQPKKSKTQDKKEHESQPKKRKTRDTEEDESQPKKRKTRDTEEDESQPKKSKTRDTEEDESQPKKSKTRDTEEDESQPKKSKTRDTEEDESQPKKSKTRDTEEDESQPKKSKTQDKKEHESQPKTSKTQDAEEDKSQAKDWGEIFWFNVLRVVVDTELATGTKRNEMEGHYSAEMIIMSMNRLEEAEIVQEFHPDGSGSLFLRHPERLRRKPEPGLAKKQEFKTKVPDTVNLNTERFQDWWKKSAGILRGVDREVLGETSGESTRNNDKQQDDWIGRAAGEGVEALEEVAVDMLWSLMGKTEEQEDRSKQWRGSAL
ncbi:hypothetical protein O3P69_007817 [Scylla paramamosain]|uniref:Uncharacterized protein n=1 Tax=Scylla paramamosain TaxID=85552 RepID=A0AAW0SGP1_SCYPA